MNGLKIAGNQLIVDLWENKVPFRFIYRLGYWWRNVGESGFCFRELVSVLGMKPLVRMKEVVNSIKYDSIVLMCHFRGIMEYQTTEWHSG